MKDFGRVFDVLDCNVEGTIFSSSIQIVDDFFSGIGKKNCVQALAIFMVGGDIIEE